MQTSRIILVVTLLLFAQSLTSYGQDPPQTAPPSAELGRAIERLDAKINRLEKELQQARKELADLKDPGIPPDFVPLRQNPNLRFPIEVERAMMGEGMERARQRGGTRLPEGNRRNEFKPERNPPR